ncbi:hypothetical protein ABZ540_15035 [Nocardia xishanensis]|uniref:hypothetical protein n=1 Tax=Nocardia xishanensis TaxID=238964 RepID=UPI0033DAE647
MRSRLRDELQRGLSVAPGDDDHPVRARAAPVPLELSAGFAVEDDGDVPPTCLRFEDTADHQTVTRDDRAPLTHRGRFEARIRHRPPQCAGREVEQRQRALIGGLVEQQ